jgi:hypothetical protein
LSPKERRGRAAPTSRRRSAHGHIDARPASALDDSRDAEGLEGLSAQGSGSHGSGPLARLRRNSILRGLYEYFGALLPVIAIFIVALAAFWGYKSFVDRPAASPAISVQAQRWTEIEARYGPERERIRAALLNDIEFADTSAHYQEFYTQTKGWVDEIRGVADWGDGQQDVTNLLRDSSNYLSLLSTAAHATTPDEINALSSSLPAADSTFTTEIALIRTSLGLSATSHGSPLPVSTGSVSPSASPSSSGSPTASGSALPSGSPSASPS